MVYTVLFSILCLSFSSHAIDLNFRFENGYCQKGKVPGTNPNFFGECGNLTKTRIINRKERNLNLVGANLNGTYTYVTDYAESDLSHVAMKRAVLLQTNFTDSKAKSIDFRAGQMKGVTFQNVDLEKLLATGARISKTSFVNCNLQGADFWGTLLLQVSFEGSDLRGANFSNTFTLLSNFQGAKFNSKTQLPFSKEKALQRGMVEVD